MEPSLSGEKEPAASEMTSVEWSVHPLRERPVTAGLVIGFLLVLHAAIYLAFHHVAFVLLTAAILLPSLAPFFFPVRYALHPQHITVQSWFRRVERAWEEFQRWEITPQGLFLSPFRQPSRLDNFRGLYLRFGTQGEKVMRYLQRRWQGQDLNVPRGLIPQKDPPIPEGEKPRTSPT